MGRPGCLLPLQSVEINEQIEKARDELEHLSQPAEKEKVEVRLSGLTDSSAKLSSIQVNHGQGITVYGYVGHKYIGNSYIGLNSIEVNHG